MLSFCRGNKIFCVFTFLLILAAFSISYSLELKDIFTGFATIFSAWTVLAVYFYQQWNVKVEAAKILLMEIRNAEEMLGKIKSDIFVLNSTPEVISVLPVNSWVKYQYLFIADLDHDNLKLINDFYKYCYIVDQEVGRIKHSQYFAHDQKSSAVQQKLMQLATDHKDDKDDKKLYENEKDKILKIFYSENQLFTEGLAGDRIIKYTNTTQYITTSTCGAKLKLIANQ